MADGTQANTQQAWHAPAWFAKTTASIPLALAGQRRRHQRPRLTPHCPFEQPCVGETTSCPFGFFSTRNVLMPDRKLNLGNRSLISLCLACFEPAQPSDQARPPYTSPSSHTRTFTSTWDRQRWGVFLDRSRARSAETVGGHKGSKIVQRSSASTGAQDSIQRRERLLLLGKNAAPRPATRTARHAQSTFESCASLLVIVSAVCRSTGRVKASAIDQNIPRLRTALHEVPTVVDVQSVWTA
jgi:hypothetical protein